MRLRTTLAGMLFLAARLSSAQCPDGTPPPCRSAMVASAARRDPPLDEQKWIVVPFDNLSGSQEIEWLRSGSVNLLYMGLSRWTDLRVIDDERVADYMREVPGASSAKQLSLNQGVAIARKAGAGRLVMGDLLRLGNRTTVNAKVFDVKTGRRLRTVREDTAIPDSLLPMFAQLSQKVLSLAAPPGSAGGIFGTKSRAAYEEFAKGMYALNGFALPVARDHFETALAIDSTFALAHSKLAVVLGWMNPSDPLIRQHAEMAGRLAGDLPMREKTLISAFAAFARAEYAMSCEGFRTLIRRDSTDADAWYGLGDCLYHDATLERVPGDSAKVRWRGNRNASVRAFRKALTLDPSYHLAYQHLVEAYVAPRVDGRFCADQSSCVTYSSVFRQSGDSLLAIPYTLPRDSAVARAEIEGLLRGDRKASLDSAVAIAGAWLAANPSEERAKAMHAWAQLSRGSVAVAESLYRHVRMDVAVAGWTALAGREEALIKLGRGKEALQLHDSLSASLPSQGPSSAGLELAMFAMFAMLDPVFGRMSTMDSLFARLVRGAPPLQGALVRQTYRIMAGFPTDSLIPVAKAVFDQSAAAGRGAAISRQLAPLLIYAARTWPASQWPSLDSTVNDQRTRAAVALQRGDFEYVRRSARQFDSLSRVFQAAAMPDSGFGIVAAELYLAVRDSVAALASTRRWVDTLVTFTPFLVGSDGTPPLLYVRAILLRADLAAALGSQDEARLWYGRFLQFWARAEPEAQPVVNRVRTAYAALGGR